MQATTAMVHHLLKDRWPESLLLEGKGGARGFLKAACAWSGIGVSDGRLVAVGIDDLHRADHLSRNAVFLCSASKDDVTGALENPCILVGAGVEQTQLINAALDVFNRCFEWSEALLEAVYRQHDFDALLKSLEVMGDWPCVLVDARFRCVARSSELVDGLVDEQGYVPFEAVDQLRSVLERKAGDLSHGAVRFNGDEDLLLAPVLDEKEVAGMLLTRCPEDLEEQRCLSDVLETLARHCSDLYSHTRGFGSVEKGGNALRQALAGILSGQPLASVDLGVQLHSCGFEMDDDYLLVILRSQDQGRGQAVGKDLMPRIESMWDSCVCIEVEGEFLILVDDTVHKEKTGRPFGHDFSPFLRERLLLAAVSRQFSDVYSINAAYKQAKIAFEMGVKRNPTHWRFAFDDYAFEYVVTHGFNGFSPLEVCDRRIITLIDYDNKRGTELAPTLETFLRYQCNTVATAKALFIARSTLIKRLARIDELTRIDFDDFEQRLFLSLSFQIKALSTPVPRE